MAMQASLRDAIHANRGAEFEQKKHGRSTLINGSSDSPWNNKTAVLYCFALYYTRFFL